MGLSCKFSLKPIHGLSFPPEEYYLERRGAQGAVLVTPRQLEALIRLSEARARAELRRMVTKADVEDVLELIKNGLNFQEWDMDDMDMDYLILL